ncbi:MAG: LLM class flavin-dependent oxidoreductase [Candidatus Hodarchaeota archaeon]
MDKDVKFGYTPPLHNPNTVVQLSIEADKAGFDSIWMPDHLMGIGVPDSLDPWCILSILGINNKITTKLGTCVTNPHIRHPASLAQTIVTLDSFTKGRIILGLGAGAAMNLNPYGIDWKKPVSKLREFIEVIKLLWKGRPVTYQGQFYNLNKAIIRPKPTQKYPPIWLAANKTRTLQLTGELADGWVPVRLSPELYSKDKKIIEENIKKSGRKSDEMIYSNFLFIGLGKNRDKVFKKIEMPAKIILSYSPEQTKRLGFEITSDFSPAEFIPSPKNYQKLLETAKTIPNEVLEKCFAFGSPEHVIEKIEEFVKVGNNHFILSPEIMPGTKTFIKDFSEKVLPYFK